HKMGQNNHRNSSCDDPNERKATPAETHHKRRNWADRTIQAGPRSSGQQRPEQRASPDHGTGSPSGPPQRRNPQASTRNSPESTPNPDNPRSRPPDAKGSAPADRPNNQVRKYSEPLAKRESPRQSGRGAQAENPLPVDPEASKIPPPTA